MSPRPTVPCAAGRSWLRLCVVVALVAAGTGYVLAPVPAHAYEANDTTTGVPTGAPGGQAGTIAYPSGLTLSATLTGTETVNDVTSTMGTSGSSSALYTPAIATTTPSFRFLSSPPTGCRVPASAGTDPACVAIGTITLAFSRPVRNPVIYVYGLGASNASGTAADRSHSVLRLTGSSPGGATLGAASAGATNLAVTSTKIDVTDYNASTACNSTTATPAYTSFAGCGSVPVNGTVSSLTFTVDFAGVQIAGGSGTSTADAFGLTATVDQDFADAPASYNGAQAPAHVVGDLKLGATVDADNTGTANATASPFPASGVAVNTGGDNSAGADEDAVTAPFPRLTTAMIGSAYSVTVPITGASASGQVCGYVDFDHAGTFAAAADKTCTAFASGDTAVTLTWTVPAATTAGLTYARLRAAYGVTQAANPTGLASSGEVEDYALAILPTVVVRKLLPNGATGTFDLTVNGTTVATGVGNNGTSGVKTVGQSLGATITTPNVTVGQDVSAAAVPLTVTETGSGGNAGTYTSTYACVNGAGTTVASGTGTSISTSIPQSGPSNGLAQNVTCTFTNAGTGALTLTKTAAPTTVNAVGQTVTYTFGVTNSGNLTVSALAVADTQNAPAGALNAAPACVATTLAPGATTTCSATYTVTQADIDSGSITDSATATGTATGGGSVTSNTSTASVTATRTAALTLTKSASTATVTGAGQTITYTFHVLNSGNVTATGLAITDTQGAPAGALTTGPTCTVTTLAPGAATDCTATYVSTQADIDSGSVNDSAHATATGPGGTITSNTSTASVSATAAPQLTLSITPAPTSAPNPGTTITYTFHVVNSGNVTVTGLAINNTQTPPAGALATGPTCTTTTLAPGAATDCTATYTTTSADTTHGSVHNSATATGLDPNSGTVTSNTASATVSTVANPQLTLTKTASPTTVTGAGQTVTYSFHVVNSGNVTVTGLSVTDTQTAPAGTLATGPTCGTTTLAAGASTDCTGTYTTTQADINHGSIADHATASGTSAAGAVTSNQATASVTATRSPGLALTKTASPTTVTAAGQTVTYSFHVTNSGNVTITGLAIADTQSAPAGALATGPTCSVTTLQPGDSTTCTATYHVTVADMDSGSVSDTATASGSNPTGTSTSNTSTASVTANRTPALTLTGTRSPASVTAAGRTVTYTYHVANSGNVTVTDITVDAAQTAPAGALATGPTCPHDTLAPGASMDCTATYEVTQADMDGGATIVDTATAHGLLDSTGVDSNTVTLGVAVAQSPALDLVKMASPASVSKAGQAVSYRFVVSNTGNVTVHAIAVTDVQTAPAGTLDAAPACPASTLAPGHSTTCTATYTATAADVAHGTIKDTATAAGDDPDNDPVTPATARLTVNVAEYTATTSASPTGPLDPGTTMRFTVTVHNTGTTPLTLPVSDDITDVIDDATYQDDVTSNYGTVHYAGGHLSWTGTIPAGKTLVIRFHAVVKAYSAGGNHSIVSRVLVQDAPPGGDCARGCVDALSVADPSSGGLAFTGAEVGAATVGGSVLLLAGFALLVASTRRRRSS